MCVTKKSHNAKPHFATESIIIVLDTPGEKIGTALEMKNDIVAFGEYTNVPPSREFVRPSIHPSINCSGFMPDIYEIFTHNASTCARNRGNSFPPTFHGNESSKDSPETY